MGDVFTRFVEEPTYLVGLMGNVGHLLIMRVMHGILEHQMVLRLRI